MIHDVETSEVLQSIAKKGLQLLAGLKEQPTHPSMVIEKALDLSRIIHSTLEALYKNPEKLWLVQAAYWQEAHDLLQTQLKHWQEGNFIPCNDKRFNHDEWLKNPFFNHLSQQYLLASKHFNSLLKHLDIEDKQLAKRIQFFASQYLDALSPDNFLHTNPQLITETLQSQGKNLLRGLDNLLSDIEKGSARFIMKMTDMGAFKIGQNIAVTPGKIIYRNALMELIQYTPQTPKVKAIPLLIIPPWINKYYILDLSPENSLINWLVRQGITVFTISWVNPDARHAQKGLYSYLNEGPLTAIKIIRNQLGVKQVNTLGFCIGGTLQALLLAYLNAQNKQYVRSATFLAAMIDFHDPGDISVFIDEEQITRLEEKMKDRGYLDGHLMACAFNSLRARDLVWSFFIKHYLQGKAPAAFDILYWNADSTNMPARMHSEYLRWMYLHNELIKPNKIRLNKVPINIQAIDTPAFFVATQKDHIAPWQTVYAGFKLLKGRKRFLLGGSGHIAGIINPAGSEKYGYKTRARNSQSPDHWYACSNHHQGSWWPEWFSWLQKQAGRVENAPNWEKLKYKGIMDAPGSYVLNKK